MKQVQTTGNQAPVVNDMFAAMAEELKHQVITLDTSASMNDKFYSGGLVGCSKMYVAKALLAEEAKRRAAIGPLFALCGFDYTATELVPIGGELPKMLEAIEGLETGGGTAIGSAVADGIRRLHMNPSPAGVNHLIIVTDAEDRYSAEDAKQDAAIARGSEVVVDVILIVKPGTTNARAADGLNVLATGTNGRFSKVEDARDLETAFRAVASRSILLLES